MPAHLIIGRPLLESLTAAAAAPGALATVWCEVVALRPKADAARHLTPSAPKAHVAALVRIGTTGLAPLHLQNAARWTAAAAARTARSALEWRPWLFRAAEVVLRPRPFVGRRVELRFRWPAVVPAHLCFHLELRAVVVASVAKIRNECLSAIPCPAFGDPVPRLC